MLFWNSVANNLIWQKRCTIPAMLHKQVFWRKWLFMFNMLLYSLVHIHIYVILYNNINNQQWNVEQGVELYIYDFIVIPSEWCQPPTCFYYTCFWIGTYDWSPPFYPGLEPPVSKQSVCDTYTGRSITNQEKWLNTRIPHKVRDR